MATGGGHNSGTCRAWKAIGRAWTTFIASYPAAIDIGIERLTLYAFSTENWGRPYEEVSGLMRLFTLISRRETENLHRQGVRVEHIGTLEGVGAALAGPFRDAVVLTAREYASAR